MAWTKAKTAVVGAIVVLLAAGTTTVTVKEIQEHRTYPWQTPPGSGNELDELPPQVRILRSKYSKFSGASRNGKTFELGAPIGDVLAAAYGVGVAHVFFSTESVPGKYDFFANLPEGNQEALQKEVKRKFGLVGTNEVRDTDVLLLKVGDAAKLQAHVFKGQVYSSGPGGLQYGKTQLSGVAEGVESVFEKPVLDQTGMTGQYTFLFLANETDWNAMQSRIDSVRQTFTKELARDGLELVPTNMPVEMLVVQKTGN